MLASMNSPAQSRYSAICLREGYRKALQEVRGEQSRGRKVLQRAVIEISRQQKAKSWELRATTSLARLLAQQRHRDEARAMLAEIYNWFTEGFDTRDLKDANAVLEELNE